MTATILDGTVISQRMRAEIAQDAARFEQQYGYPPALGVVLVGDDPASEQYVRMKRRACEQAGIRSIPHLLPTDSTQEQVEAAVKSLNDDPSVHGILVQLPVPPHIDEEAVLRLIDISKDSDGVHPLNIGLLAMKGREPLFVSATPSGCLVLLKEAGAVLPGANAVVVGRSNIVGLPVSLLLMKENATVTICHSRTRDLPDYLRNADIVVVAMNRPNYIKGEWLKPGAVVIDVGTSKIDDPTDSRGYRWVGDVDFDSAVKVAGAITKVPGGVGPMTITMLLANTMKAAWRLAGKATL